VGEEPNHATARKPGPLYIIQYSLYRLYNCPTKMLEKISAKVSDRFAEINFTASVEKPNQTQCCARWDKQSQSHFACSDLIITDEKGGGSGGGVGVPAPES
jgi:hypothetical protein